MDTVGAAVVGAEVVGLAVVGAAVVGAEVVGAAVVGAEVVGLAVGAGVGSFFLHRIMFTSMVLVSHLSARNLRVSVAFANASTASPGYSPSSCRIP